MHLPRSAYDLGYARLLLSQFPLWEGLFPHFLLLFIATPAYVIMRRKIRLLGVLTPDLAGGVTHLLVCIARLAGLAGYPFSAALGSDVAGVAGVVWGPTGFVRMLSFLTCDSPAWSMQLMSSSP